MCEIFYETDVSKLDSIWGSTPKLTNTYTQKQLEDNSSIINKIEKAILFLSSWENHCGVHPNTTLLKRTAKLEKILGAKPVKTTILGNENLMTKVWYFYINNREYLLFYNNSGLTMTSPHKAMFKEKYQDLLCLIDHTGLIDRLDDDFWISHCCLESLK